jgi:hypothetical protein
MLDMVRLGIVEWFDYGTMSLYRHECNPWSWSETAPLLDEAVYFC